MHPRLCLTNQGIEGLLARIIVLSVRRQPTPATQTKKKKSTNILSLSNFFAPFPSLTPENECAHRDKPFGSLKKHGDHYF